MPTSVEFTMMPENGTSFTKTEWELKKEEIKKRKPEVLKHIDKSTHMSQGFRLVNNKAYQQALAELKASLQGQSFRNTEQGKVAQLMYSILTDDNAFKTYLSEEMQVNVVTSPNGTSKIMSKGASFKAKNQLANAHLKRKQLFMMYREIIQAQEELKEFSKHVVSLFNGKLSVPPGAYGGIKSFNGALDKITNRNPLDDIGDLKDCARMTIEFDSIRAMSAAKVFISRTKEFKDLQHYQSALKDRYGLGSKLSGLSQFNKKAQGSGYKDIKFFLKMKNGIIGELQLNISGMLVAKEKEHVIYDILRDAEEGAKTFTIVNKDVLDKVKHHMNPDWFQFIDTRIPSVRPQLMIVRQMLSRLNGSSVSSLTVSETETEALKTISLALYAQGENGKALL
ncbi:hypothetical protein L1D33_05405 [Vibrio chagasii]|uniref:hypothetical protein n=1 Tax=Vibrio chagasii TaxID=170679 RepID=UPI001EFC6C0D|nr:hypothetical protein [Vibrio chagasii]MCG9672999.1 hypothetical protein [Vibrio chagasii]